MSKLTIDSEFVGVPWKEDIREITWRQTTNYAASLDDMNPLYFDEEQEGGLYASPMFPVTLIWRIILADRAKYAPAGLPYPQEVWDQLMHYTEYIDFKRLLRPGVKVRIKSQISAMIPQRAGTQIVFRFDVEDFNDGKPYYTEYVGSMLRGVECPDGGKGSLPEYQQTKYSGNALWESPAFCNQALPYVYDGCGDLVFAIHTSPKFARSVGLKSNVLHGTANLAIGIKEVINRELGGDARRVKALAGKFTSMIFANDNLRVQLFDRKVSGDTVELYFQVLNESTGKVAVTYGYVKASM